MKCKCGYSLFVHAMNTLETGFRTGASYGIIRDDDYTTFVQLQTEAAQCKDEESLQEANMRVGEYVGSAQVCPNCSRLIFIAPKTFEVTFYKREE